MEHETNAETPVLMYIMVVGFHHKKGCLVEYCYPELDRCLFESDGESESTMGTSTDGGSLNDDHSINLPLLWSTLPSMAIPDGAHNYKTDSIFFHLPDPLDQSKTVYCVACYQQIETKSLLVRSPDMTRGSVQKSIVALLSLPVYGLLEEKLKIVTQNYFDYRDFSQVSILKDFYLNMNQQLTTSTMESLQIFSSFSLRKLFKKFGPQVIVLFKLLLLEKKSIFIISSIRELTTTILSICSLIPGMIENGLNNCSLPLVGHVYDEEKILFDKLKKKSQKLDSKKVEKIIESNDRKMYAGEQSNSDSNIIKNEPFFDLLSSTEIYQGGSNEVANDQSLPSIVNKTAKTAIRNNEEQNEKENDFYGAVIARSYQHYGLPLQIFAKNSYCLPYFSISYFDALVNEQTRCCFAGTSNHIFKRWENDIDLFICDDSIEIRDLHLKRMLNPTVEDMRFMSYVMKSLENEDGVIVDEDFNYTSNDYREGSDEWIRCFFKNYLLHMLRCSFLNETYREYRAFNVHFMNSWKETHNYRSWLTESHVNACLRDVEPQHPFADNRLNNFRFKVSNFFAYRSSLISQAQSTTTKIMANPLLSSTLSTARTTVNSWFNNISSNLPTKMATSIQKRLIDAVNATNVPKIIGQNFDRLEDDTDGQTHSEEETSV